MRGQSKHTCEQTCWPPKLHCQVERNDILRQRSVTSGILFHSKLPLRRKKKRTSMHFFYELLPTSFQIVHTHTHTQIINLSTEGMAQNKRTKKLEHSCKSKTMLIGKQKGGSCLVCSFKKEYFNHFITVPLISDF